MSNANLHVLLVIKLLEKFQFKYTSIAMSG